MIPGHDERGIAIASVLWTVAALSLIALAMLLSSMNEARTSRVAWAQIQVQTAADTAVQRALLTLFNPRPDQRPPVDGTGREMSLGNMTARVSIQDQTGLIDVNYAGRTLLGDLFKSAGAEPADADTLADRVIAWRTPKNSGSLSVNSNGDYRDAESGYAPRGGPFQSVAEVALVMGMTPSLFARVAPALTVYSHQANLDLRIAPREALLAIPGMTEANVAQAESGRTAPAALPGHALSIVAEVRSGRIQFTRHAVVQISSDPAHTYWFLAWE
jgi:general secretion pathway protein K